MESLPLVDARHTGAPDMNAGFGSWLLGTSLGANALGGMLGMAIGIFIVLATTTFGSALLYAISGFGFAVLAALLFLSFLAPRGQFNSSSSSRPCAARVFSLCARVRAKNMRMPFPALAPPP